MSETYAATILSRETNQLIKETGNPNLRSTLDKGQSPVELFHSAIFRPMKMLFKSPIVTILATLAAVF
jgi:hypothetical protein